MSNIFALSTVLGKSGIAVIRVSGPRSKEVAALLGYKKKLEHKKAVFTAITVQEQEEVLDEVILLFFQAPHSFNGEDILEIQMHGSIAVISDVLNELNKIDFLRVAEPGEFTKTAFQNGKIDLVRAEALADLLDAETSMQRSVANKQLSGELSTVYNKWRSELIKILSQLESLIDFPDDDIPESVLISAELSINLVMDEISSHLIEYERAKSIVEGIKVVISGAPNVGKSSLINAISKKDIAIVSDIAGTTRDVLQIRLNLSGFAVSLSDTAGIRNSKDPIEMEGINRAKKAIAGAAINIVMVESPDDLDDQFQHLNDNEDKELIVLINKADLQDEKQLNQAIEFISLKLYRSFKNYTVIAISTYNKDHIDDLLKLLAKKITNAYQDLVFAPLTTKIRQKRNLEECLKHLRKFHKSDHLEIAAQNIRIASEFLGIITGKISVEEILDEIFTSFCIGK